MTTTSPKKILIVNGAATFNGHGGTLNMHYSESVSYTHLTLPTT